MSAITAKASRKMKKYAVLTREPRCFLGSFDFSWEQRKWINTVDISTNMVDPKSGKYDLLPHVAPGNIESFTGRLYDNVKLVGEENLISGKFVFNVGDIVYGKINPQLGKYVFARFSGLTSADAYVLNAKNGIVQKFLYAVIQTRDFYDYSVSVSKRSGMPKINRDELNAYSYWAPSESEQLKIGEYLLTLDHLITLHQRKCALLFSPFQAFISMMFTTSTFSWEQRKLSEITDKVTEKNAGLQYVETFTNSAEFGIISQRDFFDHDIAKLGSLDGYYIVKTEDFVYNPRISTSAPVGPINRNKLGRTGVMSPLYTVFRPHDIDTTYLEYFFKCGYWHSFMNFNGDSGARSDRFSIRDNVFFQMPIPIPDIDEQRKIGELLTCLDNLITLHQRKCIFFTGRAGRLISTVNKKRITSSWEQRKLGDMMNVTSVKRIHQSDWTDSGVRFLRARDIVAAAKNEEPDDYLYISKEKYEEYSTLSGKVGVSDLLVTGVGTIGVPYLVRNLEPLYFKDGNIIWFQNSDKIDGKFLFYSFSAEQIQGFINESAGIGTVGTYTIESGKKTPISLPNQIEQAKVGEFFQQLDNLITLHQRKPFLMKWRTSDANRNQTNRLVL